MRTHDEEQVRPQARPVREVASSKPAGSDLADGPVLAAATLTHLQRIAGNAGVNSLLEADEDRSPVLDVIGSRGAPLDSGLRSEMEASFGENFGDVRLHTGPAAAESARSVQAQAYTVGNDVVFSEGHDPDSTRGRHTLAHELTHVVQQRAGPVEGSTRANGISLSDPTDRFEQEAERVASSVCDDAASTGTDRSAPSATVQRQEDPNEEVEEP